MHGSSFRFISTGICRTLPLLHRTVRSVRCVPDSCIAGVQLVQVSWNRTTRAACILACPRRRSQLLVNFSAAHFEFTLLRDSLKNSPSARSRNAYWRETLLGPLSTILTEYPRSIKTTSRTRRRADQYYEFRGQDTRLRDPARCASAGANMPASACSESNPDSPHYHELMFTFQTF